jgi:hypothetical protein
MRLLMVAALISSGLVGQPAGPDMAELLRRWVQADNANTEKTHQYAYRAYNVTVEKDKDGKEDRKTETWDVIGLEGSTYRKLIQRNDQPLGAKEQKREDARLAKETAWRRKETPGKRRNRTLSLSYSIGTLSDERTMELYNFEFKGKELVDGRDSYLVEGLAKPGARPANDNEKENLNFRVRMWIDAEDFVQTRGEMEAISEHSRMQKGSLIEFRKTREESGVWLSKEIHVRLDIRFFKMVGMQLEFTETYSNYRRFQVDSRVIDGRP